RAGRILDIVGGPRASGIKDQARLGREQSQRNYPGDQIPGIQSAEPVTGQANSRHRKKERRPASRNSVCARSRLRGRNKLQKFQRLNSVSSFVAANASIFGSITTRASRDDTCKRQMLERVGVAVGTQRQV